MDTIQGRIVWIYSIAKEDPPWTDDNDKSYVKKYYEKGWHKKIYCNLEVIYEESFYRTIDQNKNINVT